MEYYTQSVDPTTGAPVYIHSVTGEHVWSPKWVDVLDAASGYWYYTNTQVRAAVL